MAMNFASAITAREYYSCHGNWGPAPSNFVHQPPNYKPSSPDISALSTGEKASLNNWMAAVDSGAPSALSAVPTQTIDGDPFSSAANTAAAAFVTYFATAAYKNWLIDNILSRESQWRWRCADIHDANTAAVPPSASSSGTGSGVPSSTPPASTN